MASPIMDQTQILTGGRLRCVVILLNLANAVAFADITSISSISSAAATDFHARGLTTWAITSALVASAIGQCLLGYLSDTCGRRRMLITALILLIFGSLGCAASHRVGSPTFFYVYRAMTGAGVGGVSNLVNIIQNDFLSPEQRAKY